MMVRMLDAFITPLFAQATEVAPEARQAQAHGNGSLWPMLVGLFTVTVCVGFHVKVLLLLVHWMLKAKPALALLIPVLVVSLLLNHGLQIILFAFAYAGLEHFAGPEAGHLIGDYNRSATDLFYFSSVVYTTVGFGDIRPEGDFRIIAAIEALCGMLLVALSASFTFVVIQQSFREQFKHLIKPKDEA